MSLSSRSDIFCIRFLKNDKRFTAITKGKSSDAKFAITSELVNSGLFVVGFNPYVADFQRMAETLFTCSRGVMLDGGWRKAVGTPSIFVP